MIIIPDSFIVMQSYSHTLFHQPPTKYPYAPCMEYLPTFAQKITQMWVNIPAPWSIWEDIPIESHEIPRNKIAFPNASLFLADGVRHPNPRAFFSAHQPAAGSIEGPKFLKHFQDGLKKGQPAMYRYPLVNVYITMENQHAINARWCPIVS